MSTMSSLPTGYKVQVQRLTFLDEDLRLQMKTIADTPTNSNAERFIRQPSSRYLRPQLPKLRPPNRFDAHLEASMQTARPTQSTTHQQSRSRRQHLDTPTGTTIPQMHDYSPAQSCAR
jgi:hypothetical protein